MIERLLESTLKIFNIKIDLPIQRMSYDESMDKYGTDAPDLRFGMEINDISNVFVNTDFQVFKTVLANNGKVLGIKVDGGASFSRKELEGW